MGMIDGTTSQASAKPSNGVGAASSSREQARRLIAALVSDGRLFWRHSFTRSARHREQLRGRIAMDLHSSNTEWRSPAPPLVMVWTRPSASSPTSRTM